MNYNIWRIRMRFKNGLIAGVALFLMVAFITPAIAQSNRIAYINSQKILANFKDAIDAQNKIDELNRKWEKEGMEMQKELQDLQERFESQSLLLSESKKAEKAQEIQNLYLQIQQFQQEKWAPGNGQIYKKQEEFMAPVLEKINAVIKKIGDNEKYDYIFDTVAGNILYAGDEQQDLTDKVLEELNKGAAAVKE